MSSKTLFCNCGEEVSVGDDDISIQCWRCTMKKVEQVENRRVKPITEYFSIEEIVESLYRCKINNIRKSLQYTQGDMAKELGMSQQSYSRCERLIPPTRSRLKRVENFLNKQQLKIVNSDT